MKRKQLLITFDYELFLGERSGKVDNCLINPTNKIVKILDKHKLKAIFFVDSVYLYRLSLIDNANAKADFEKIKSQLQKLLKNGHYIFPHIHPHWLDALYLEDINAWDLSNLEKYRFASLNQKERDLVFNSSFTILNSIIAEVDESYKLDAYRAGGWSIQPFSDFKPYFKAYKIENDFSVLKGATAYTNAQQFDYSDCPNENIYQFEDDVRIATSSGSFKEFTISTHVIPRLTSFLNKFVLKYLWKINDRGGKGGSGIGVRPLQLAVSSIINLEEMVSIELLTITKLKAYNQFLKTRDYMHFISHPKMLKNHNIEVFDLFLRMNTTKYIFETDYKKIN